jgi:TonB-dependent starch-binding outer membrane protein SusC
VLTPGVGNQYNNTLRAAFNTSPFVPVYDNEGNFWDNSNGWNTGEANPYALMVLNNQNERNNQRLLGDLYLEVEPIKNLKLRTSLGLDLYSNSSHSFNPIYRLSSYAFRDFTSVFQSMDKGRTWIWDNLISYALDLPNEHHVDVMVGTAAYNYAGTFINGSNRNLIFTDLEHAWLNNATNTEGGGMMSVNGGPNDDDRRMSYFGRVNYNFKETYLLNVTFRRDGSSKFASNVRWGNFPSVSAGWVLSNEAFMAGTNWVSSFKLRASWGQVGSQAVPAYQFMGPVTYAFTNYSFGNAEGVLTPGAYASRLANPNLKWETSEQINVGFDARFLDGRLNVAFDWYNKTTKDWIINAPILATAGADAPYINGGDVTNKGIELAVSYNSSLGDLNYTVGVNGAYNKNQVGRIPNQDGIVHGLTNQLFDNSLEFNRAQNGFPIGYFWGLQTAGLFQTEADVNNHRGPEGQLIQPAAQPGDVRFVDRNNDGSINDLDRTMIGDPNPDFTFGFNISATYKGFDIGLQASGVAGNEIVQSYRNHASPFSNYTSAILDRWHGPGSSNSMPRVTEDNRNWTNFSDLYIHDGDYLRINNLTLGYDFAKLVKMKSISQVRLYASVLNLATLTKYEGMDPEIGYGVNSYSSGIDLGYYPRPRTYMLGLNVKF